ncbi:hypothetical protein D2A34_13100 [Clostridium chromiireducens]|uniref:Uncharacterized protein n=1 Tax=Clostridium chromiireducens TaxID=225345 RepID=A0A399IM48_9CLOT|nr:hypothetical protein D2A34_13100 [Clostridium chromiireducens]
MMKSLPDKVVNYLLSTLKSLKQATILLLLR